MTDNQQIGQRIIGNIKASHQEWAEMIKIVQEVQVHFDGFKAAFESPAIAIPTL